MCLIIFSPNIAHIRLRKSVLEQAFHRNGDGAGMAYVQDGKIKLSKAYFEFDKFFEAFQSIRTNIKKGAFLIHFRRGTGGSNNKTNTQPLVIYRDKLVMAHNGQFPVLEETEKDISDSVVLSRLIRGLAWKYPFLKIQKELLNRLCGDLSKLVFMDEKGRYSIINEKLGKWSRGSWYSNPNGIDVFSYKNSMKYAPPCRPWQDEEAVYSPHPLSPFYNGSQSHMTTEQKKRFEEREQRMAEIYRPDNSLFKKNPHKVDPDLLTEEEWRCLPN